MVVQLDRSVGSDPGWKLFRGAGVFVVALGGLVVVAAIGQTVLPALV